MKSIDLCKQRLKLFTYIFRKLVSGEGNVSVRFFVMINSSDENAVEERIRISVDLIGIGIRVETPIQRCFDNLDQI